MSARKVSYLTTADFARLNDACIVVRDTFRGDYVSGIYLVGSSSQRPDFRDVDVRVILADEEFDRFFAAGELFWGLFCLGVSEHLCRITGLPIDFQVQRMTEANEKYGDAGNHPRNPLGHRNRSFAGGGDATNFRVVEDVPRGADKEGKTDE